jgi:hypothetical protein
MYRCKSYVKLLYTIFIEIDLLTTYIEPLKSGTPTDRVMT